MVRLEALKGWVRQRRAGSRAAAACSPRSPISDPNVFLYALDALGDQCKDDIVVTDRLTAEARTPPAAGVLATAGPRARLAGQAGARRAALVMPAFAGHQRWQVRMYAARAAAAADDVATLKRLALDDDDNVREATLAGVAAPAAATRATTCSSRRLAGRTTSCSGPRRAS